MPVRAASASTTTPTRATAWTGLLNTIAHLRPAKRRLLPSAKADLLLRNADGTLAAHPGGRLQTVYLHPRCARGPRGRELGVERLQALAARVYSRSHFQRQHSVTSRGASQQEVDLRHAAGAAPEVEAAGGGGCARGSAGSGRQLLQPRSSRPAPRGTRRTSRRRGRAVAARCQPARRADRRPASTP